MRRHQDCLASHVVALVIVAAVLAACGATQPTPEPSDGDPVGRGFPVACTNLLEPDCAQVVAAIVDRLGPGQAVSGMVLDGFACRGEVQGCADRLSARPSGFVYIEVPVGEEILIADVRADASGIVADAPQRVQAARLEPRSLPAAGPDIPFSLGHCGLTSPIDVDGSLWDPVGFVDGDPPAGIDTFNGLIRANGPIAAEFRTADGYVISLVRRVGSKTYPLCR